MHAGSIASERTKAGRLYAHLTAPGNLGRWFGGWELTLGLKISAIGTRASEVRAQLPPGEEIETERRGKDNFYRIVKNNHQDTKFTKPEGLRVSGQKEKLGALGALVVSSPPGQLCLVGDVDGRDA